MAESERAPEYRRSTISPDQAAIPRTVTISDCEVRGSLAPFKHKVYIIKCEPHFPKVISVARRYKQFLWLRNILTKQFPCVFCPALPGKRILKDDRFLEERSSDLERFLNRLQDIPMFFQNKAMLIFLTCPESTFSSKSREFERSIEVVSSDQLRKAYAHVTNFKLPTDLDFEISRYRDEFAVQMKSLEDMLKQCFGLLNLYEKSTKQMTTFNDLLGELRTVEENLPRRDLEKRSTKNLDNWVSFHDSMWQNFLVGFCRNIRYELQDALAVLDNLNQLNELRDQLETIRRQMEKWTTYQELSFEQIEQKKLDGEKETELTDLVDICAKMVCQHCEQGWSKQVAGYRSQLTNYTSLMMGSWKDIADKEVLLYESEA